MRPSHVRKRILEEHERLRVLLEELDDAARRLLEGDEALALRLRVLAEALREKFLRHLDLEDEILVPTLREIDPWGPERAKQVSEEHLEQRALFQRLFADLHDGRRPAVEVAVELRALVSALLLDMQGEEAHVLHPDVLHDDPMEPDTETG